MPTFLFGDMQSEKKISPKLNRIIDKENKGIVVYIYTSGFWFEHDTQQFAVVKIQYGK